MDKNTTLAFILIGAILIFWLFLNSPEPVKQVSSKADSTFVNKETKPEVKEKSQEEKAIVYDSSENKSIFSITDNAEKIITIENSLVKLELTTRGAKLKRYFLKNYKTWYAEDNDNFYTNQVQLINPGSSLDVEFITKDGKFVTTEDIPFQTSAKNHYYSINNDSLTIEFTANTTAGGSIRKVYTFKPNDYAFDYDIEIKNMENVISNYRYDVVWSNGINFVEKNSVDEANYSNASAFLGDEQVIVDASSPGEKATKELNGKVDWIGVRNKYFAAIIAPYNVTNEAGAHLEGSHKNIKAGVREYYDASIKVPFENKSIQKNSFKIFIGPVDYDILKAYEHKFEAIVDFGSLFGLRIIIRPISEYVLLPLFKFLHLFIPNYGFVIIVFSLIIKIALHPLTRSSLKSMKKMQQLQPKIVELKEKFKDDPQKVNKETMKLYSTYGINPAGGCLPMLLQMPIFVALWALFNVAVELRQAHFGLWINNLSSPDVIYTLPFAIPIFGITQVSGLALLLGITMFFQQKMSVKDPSQKALVYMMPVLFTLMFMSFPSGLNLYYFMFNIFSIIQQYYVNHMGKQEELVPVKNPKKSGGFMSRMMEAAEKQSQMQAAARKKKK